MPEFTEEVYKDGKLIETITHQITDKEKDNIDAGFDADALSERAIGDFKNWDNLSSGQKDRILKGLLGDFIRRNA